MLGGVRRRCLRVSPYLIVERVHPGWHEPGCLRLRRYTFNFNKLVAGVGEEEAIVRRIAAHDSFVFSVNVSCDWLKVFSRAWDEPVKL
jgi:hypothetical protein